MNRHKEPWTDTERESLRVAYRDPALKTTTIAEWLRRTPLAVLQMARSMGLQRANGKNHRRPWTPQEDAKIAELRAQNKATKTIAQALRRSKTATQFRIHTLSLPAYVERPLWTNKEINQLVEMLMARKTAAECAEHFGRTVRAIYQQTRRLKDNGRLHEALPRVPDKPIPASHWVELARRGINVSHLRR